MNTLLSLIALFIGTYCYGGSEETVYLFQNLTKTQIVAETVHTLALEELPFKSLEEGLTIIMPDNSDEIFLKVSPHKYNRTVRITIEYANQTEASIGLISLIISKLKELDVPKKLKQIAAPLRSENRVSVLGKHAVALRDEVPQKKKARTSGSDWSEREHQDFVRAVFEQGMKAASPSLIIPEMILDNPNITPERVKSHLQKYRKKDPGQKISTFMQEYEQAMSKFKQVIQIERDPEDKSQVIGAQGIAYSTDQVQTEGRAAECMSQSIVLPAMTEVEMSGALGRSLEDTFRLMHSLTAQISDEREHQRNHQQIISPEMHQLLFDELKSDGEEGKANPAFHAGIFEEHNL
ncbi:MAG: hypothetical protein AB8G05_10705 [Oligoflexales bacterium]